MQSGYFEEERKLKIKFAIILIASIVLLSGVFVAIWFYNAPTYTEMPSGDAENIVLLNEDQLLHEGLMKLDELNINYSKFLTGSADRTSLDSLNNLINTSEADFSNLIDRMYSQKSKFKNPGNSEKSDNIIHAFISSLNYRKSYDSLRMASAGLVNGKNLEGDNLTIQQLQMSVQGKDDTIKNLLSQLRFQNQLKKYDSPVEQYIQPNTEIESLQSNVKKQRDSIKILSTVYNSLIKDNSNLTDQLNKLKLNNNNNNTSDEGQMPDKINSLNNKIDDLNAELVFARVDCNLTRANGKDIIYNSRQRKDLLNESLRSLKYLSKSDNPVIQRKVKDKLQVIQNLSSTVRD